MPIKEELLTKMSSKKEYERGITRNLLGGCMMCRRKRQQIMIILIFTVMYLDAMESMQEIHPFMLPSVNQSLQAIKDSHSYGFFSDENNPVLQQARAVFNDHVVRGTWMYGQCENGSDWKMNTRCGKGLFELLIGNNKNGITLIQRAADEDQSSWAHYYLGLLILVAGKMDKPLSKAFEHFQKAHRDNPHQVASYWYRHIMAIAGWNAQLKNNWMTWLDQRLCANHKKTLSYPLAVYARTCNDTVGAEMLCLKEAAIHHNPYRDKAIGALYRYCLPKEDGSLHPYAQEAETILREIASKRNGYYLARTAINRLDEKNEAIN